MTEDGKVAPNLTGRQGTNMLSYNYDVYGEASASAGTDNPFTFDGEYTDALTGNQYLRSGEDRHVLANSHSSKKPQD